MLRFGEFSFDPGTLALTKSGARVELRPKTAILLRALLERSNAVVLKRDLINTVWQSDIVPDQSLFQAISELRRVLAPMTPIKTIPNHGYQWTSPLRPARTTARVALAAGVIAATRVQLARGMPVLTGADKCPR